MYRKNKKLKHLLWFALITLSFIVITTRSTFGQGDDDKKQPIVIDKLGDIIPLELTFIDKGGEKVKLAELIDKPTILTLVYYRCPSICSPLLQEVARVVDKLELEPGKDFQLITVSFDARETVRMSKIAHDTILSRMKRDIPADSWHFLTGSEENILKLTDAAGFNFVRDKEDFMHPATVIFLARDGKIVRYLGGLEYLPADFTLAINDATAGRARSFMQKVQKICYNYDPKGRRYVLRVNRMILVFTAFMAAFFVGFLLFKSKKHGSGAESAWDEDSAKEQMERDQE